VRPHTFTCVAAGLIVCGAGLVAAATQAAPAQAPPAGAVPMSESVFKNVQMLKGIPPDEFMDAMGMFAAALGYDCASCHAEGIHNSRDAFAESTPMIQRARGMIAMVNNINRMYFAGQPRVSCFTCHHGNYRPENIPNLALQYSELVDDPNSITLQPDRRASTDQIFARYMQALGGADRLAALTSFSATGTYAGFNTGGAEVPVDVYAKAPDQRVQIVHAPDGDSVKTFDGRNAWAAEGWRPMPLMTFTGSNQAGLRVEAIAAFPGGIRNAFKQWQPGGAVIDDKPVQVLQGSNPGELPVNFYFDEAGLLVRLVRWNRTMVGSVPTQIDYSDYREVAGVKLPFHMVVTWTDGQNTIALREVRPNVAIEASRFARPAPFKRR
jgi:hypothetical protein